MQHVRLTVSMVDEHTRPSPGETETLSGNKDVKKVVTETTLLLELYNIPNDSYSLLQSAKLKINKLVNNSLNVSVETKSKFLGFWIEKASLDCIIKK